MPTPGEHKTVQARILKYAQEIGWRYVPRGEVVQACKTSHCFGDSLLPKSRALLSNWEGDL